MGVLRLGLLLLLTISAALAKLGVRVTPDREIIITSSYRNGAEINVGAFVGGFTGEPVDCSDAHGGEICLTYGNSELRVTNRDDECSTFESSSNPMTTPELSFQVNLDSYHWFGGPEQYRQYWPTEKATFDDYSYVTKQQDNQGIAEPYWLSSSGTFYYVGKNTPLFITQKDGVLNFTAKNQPPYSSNREKVFLNLTVCVQSDAKLAHQVALSRFLGKPSGIPDDRMIRHPIWSTWARYKSNVDEETVLTFADEIIQYGFNNSQLEIDDLWETCYGSLTFDTNKFPDMKALSDTLKAKGYRVTLWIHPFINLDCEPFFSEALQKGYFVKDTSGNTNTTWWNGRGAVIDFTNPEAVSWWVGRLRSMQEENGIDSLKFDAGETSWLPQVPVLTGDLVDQPSIFTIKYMETVSQFGNMIEVRVGQRTQHLPMFVRMLDKDTKWDFRNGLPTLVTTLLQMNMVGYPLVLPDMVGGNGYGDTVTKELFIRWLQANVFMPSIQYSYVPWDFDDEAVAICKKFTDLHVQYTDKIIAAMQKATEDGSPVNPPIWWVDPTDEEAQSSDSEYLLGEDLLVAPVLEEGATSRDIYLPQGQWRDELHPDQPLIQGRTWLRNYSAALDELPYFTRVQE